MIAEEKSVKAAAVLFREGDPATYLAIIVRGEVNIQYLLGNGELRPVDTLIAGDLLGWSALSRALQIHGHLHHDQGHRPGAIGCRQGPCAVRSDAQLGYRLASQTAKLLAHRLEGARVQLAAV